MESFLNLEKEIIELGLLTGVREYFPSNTGMYIFFENDKCIQIFRGLEQENYGLYLLIKEDNYEYVNENICKNDLINKIIDMNNLINKKKT
jgi:hypothetical protein